MAALEIIPATIAAGQTVSAPVSIGVKTVVGLAMPAVWSSGALTFRISPDGASFLPFVDTSNSAIAVSTPAAGTFIGVNPTLFAAVNEFEIVCATAPAGNAVIGVAVRAAAF
jgi:hypothetical protein